MNHILRGFAILHSKKIIIIITTSRCGTTDTDTWLLRFHHISDSSSHEDYNCNFWKFQKPIEPGMCVGSEFSSSSSSWWYPWAYPTVPWGMGQWLSHASSLFLPSKQKIKKLIMKKWLLLITVKYFLTNFHMNVMLCELCSSWLQFSTSKENQKNNHREVTITNYY